MYPLPPLPPPYPAFLSPPALVLSGPTPARMLIIFAKKRQRKRKTARIREEENREQKITKYIPVAPPQPPEEVQTMRSPARVAHTPISPRLLPYSVEKRQPERRRRMRRRVERIEK